VPDSYDQWYAEAVIFGSASRPDSAAKLRSRQFELGTVGGRISAVRLLARYRCASAAGKAKKVRVVTVSTKHLDNGLRQQLSEPVPAVDRAGPVNRGGSRSATSSRPMLLPTPRTCSSWVRTDTRLRNS
jgi:hypothetical protein